MVEEYCFWDAFKVVPIINAFWGFEPCSSSSHRRFGEHIASIFRVSTDDTIAQLCNSGINVDQPLRLSVLKVYLTHVLRFARQTREHSVTSKRENTAIYRHHR
jgi:hypothetical protein